MENNDTIPVYCPHCHETQTKELEIEWLNDSHRFVCEKCKEEFYWLHDAVSGVSGFCKKDIQELHHKTDVLCSTSSFPVRWYHYLLGYFRCVICQKPICLIPQVYTHVGVFQCGNCDQCFYPTNYLRMLIQGLLIWMVCSFLLNAAYPIDLYPYLLWTMSLVLFRFLPEILAKIAKC